MPYALYALLFLISHKNKVDLVFAYILWIENFAVSYSGIDV